MRQRQPRGSTTTPAAYAAREAFRVIRSNLLVNLDDLERPTVIVTSATAGEGKTATCAGLAMSLAAAGLRVVAVDLDLRHPDLHRRLGARNEGGVTDVLLGRRPFDECLQYVEVGEGRNRSPLYLLATGPMVPDPAELLASSRMTRMLDVLSRQADVVLIDTPPVVPVADTLVIGRMVAGAILVVEARRTPVPTVQRAKDALIRNQTRLLGLVVNKLPHQRGGDTYGYGYGTPTAELAAPDDA